MITTLRDWRSQDVSGPVPGGPRAAGEGAGDFDEQRRRWILTRYHDIVAVLRDNERFSAEHDVVTSSMLTSNPPEHTRLRALVSRGSRRAGARTGPRIQQIVDDLLEAVEPDGGMDAVAQFAYPLPITVIAELLGVDTDRRDFFREASQKVAVAIGPIDDHEVSERAREGRDQLVEYFIELIERRRRETRDDLMTRSSAPRMRANR